MQILSINEKKMENFLSPHVWVDFLAILFNGANEGLPSPIVIFNNSKSHFCVPSIIYSLDSLCKMYCLSNSE